MKLVLNLDGGGIRGIFEIIILSLIEKHIGKPIYEIFDCVVGVSAGAISAAMIATKKYKHVKDGIINPKKIFHNKTLGIFEPMYDGRYKTKVLTDIFGDMKMSDLKLPTALLTVEMKNGEPYTFTSIDSNSKNILVREVVDASSSAPVYFAPTTIENKRFIDGGVVNNDPVFNAIDFANMVYPNKEKAVLSIGTGSATNINVDENDPQLFGMVYWLSQNIIDVITGSRMNYNAPSIKKLLGENNYLRITTYITGDTDDITEMKRKEIIKSAHDIWEKDGQEIIKWIITHLK
jgi:patatin-like phospholipase/acyl hydrolase